LGSAEAITSGELYEQAAALSKQRGMPAPRAVIRVKVERITNLGLPGAGDDIV
jgi:hypothetical protein